jgi:putative DNA primase/helicase
MAGGRKSGCYFVIGNLENSEQIFICEGYATGATIHECTSTPVVVAFDTSGLKPVAKLLRAKYPDAKIVVCADNDQFHENCVNPGVEKATEAAKEAGAYVVKPEFKDLSTKPTDFNDLFVLEGIEAVQNALQQMEEKESPGFHLSEEGLFFIFEKDGKKIRISNYIAVQAFVKEKDGTTSRLVEFRDYQNRLVKTLLPAKLFANGGDQAKVHLISKGFISSWSSFEKCKLMEYLLQSIPEKEVSVVGRTGYIDKAYVRSDIVIGDLSEELILDVSIGDATFASQDLLDNWIKNVSAYCHHNSRLIFCASMAFASMLLKPCGIQSGGFHLAGNSSSGKTTCLRVAASIFGSPRYLKTWRTTDNALEGIAFKRNDALLVLDEISEMSHKVGSVAYMFADGEGKDRMDKNCDLKETFQWRLLFLSSGEADLAAHLAEFDKKSKAGQEVRFVSIPANSLSEQNGIFEDLHGFSDVAEFSKHLQENTATYYGAASIEFVKKVLEDSNIKELYREDFRRMKMSYLPENASSQDKRVFERCMFVGFAGELATRYGLTGWPGGTAYDAALKCFNSWLREKGGVGDLEEKRLMNQAKAFLDAYVSSRFHDIDGFKDQKISNLAGYKREVENELVYYITSSVFRDEICKGFNKNYAVEVFQKKGALQGYLQKWTPHGNKRVYVLSGKAFGEYE